MSEKEQEIEELFDKLPDSYNFDLEVNFDDPQSVRWKRLEMMYSEEFLEWVVKVSINDWLDNAWEQRNNQLKRQYKVYQDNIEDSGGSG